MVDYQLKLKPFSYSYADLTDMEHDFINYFSSINRSSISSVIDRYYHTRGPTGYGDSLFLSRILKIKELFFSDRILSDKLAKNEIYRFVCLMDKNTTPAHNTYNTLRKSLGAQGFSEIHKNFVKDANRLGLINPNLPELPKNRKKGIILIADSTFIRAYGSTKGEKQPDGTWLFKDNSLAFGRRHHKYRYPVGHKAHSLMTVTGIPVVSHIAACNIHDQYYIIPLLDEFRNRFPNLNVAYVVLDAGYDTEEIYRIIYDSYNIIPIIVRGKMVYPKEFSSDGRPKCSLGYPMTSRGIDYKYQRTRFFCKRICKKDPQRNLESCPYLNSKHPRGLMKYTYFKDSYRKFGPALPTSIIYKRLKPYRTAIERNYGLVKENRYRLEYTNTYMGFSNVHIHVIEHDIALTQDIIYNFQRTGKISSVLKP